MDRVFSDIKNKGHRLTKPRKAIVKILEGSSTPLSAVEIQEALKMHKVSADKATVYRNIEFLTEEGLIESVHLNDGAIRYEIKETHHHHLICTNCHKVTHADLGEFEKALEAQEKDISQNNAFKITSHQLEFYGECENCK